MTDYSSSFSFRPVARRSYISPEEEQSLLSSLSGNALSGLAYLGESLDKPMAAVRGLLAGRPEELANLIPFSDALGITSSEGLLSGTALQVTDDENTVDGRELLETYDLVGENVEGFGGSGPEWDFADAAGDVAGFLVDMVGPPVAMGGKALTSAGKMARKTGLLDEATAAAQMAGKGKAAARMQTVGSALDAARPEMRADLLRRLTAEADSAGMKVDDVLKQSMGNRAQVKLPFMKERSLDFIADPVANQVARRTQWLRDSRPAALAANMFDAAGSKFSNREFQRAAGPRLAQRTAEAEAAARQPVARFANDIGRQVNLVEEIGGGGPGALTRGIYDVMEFAEDGSRVIPDTLAAARDPFRRALDESLAKSDSLGIDASRLEDDFIDYMSRQVLGMNPAAARSSGAQALSGVDPRGMVHRAESLKNTLGGTRGLSELGPQAVREAAPGVFERRTLPELQKLAETVTTEVDQAPHIAKFLSQLPVDTLRAGIYTDPLNIAQARLLSAARSQARAETLADILADQDLLSRAGKWATDRGGDIGASSVGDVVGGLGLDQNKFLANVLKRQGLDVTDDTLENLAGTPLPAAVASDLTQMLPNLQGPLPMQPVLDATDSLTNYWKAMQTGVWPSFHVRNLLSGQARELMRGMNPVEQSRARGLARGISKGTVTPDQMSQLASIPAVQKILAQRGQGSEYAADVARELQQTHIPNMGQGYGADVVGQQVARGQAAAQSADGVLDIGMAGGPQGRGGFSYRDMARKASEVNPESLTGIRRLLSPVIGSRNVRGVGGRSATTYGPAAAGEMLGEHYENLNRLTPFLLKMQQGVDPARAAREVLETQIDYSPSAYTAMENQLLKRLLPFYKFARSNTPGVARELMENPGGRTAAFFKGMAALPGVRGTEQQPLPDHIADTVAIPMGVNPDGSTRFLSGLGLMEEDLLGFVNPDNMLQDGFYELLGRTNPIVKAFGEIATGQSFFQQGRELSEMDPTIGRLLSNISDLATGERTRSVDPFIGRTAEALASNSPISRLLSTLRGLTDKRKYDRSLTGVTGDVPLINLLTGLRFSDVTDAQMDRRLSEAIGEAYRDMGGREYTNIFIPEDRQARMDSSQLRQIDLLRALQKRLRDQRARRAAGQ